MYFSLYGSLAPSEQVGDGFGTLVEMWGRAQSASYLKAPLLALLSDSTGLFRRDGGI